MVQNHGINDMPKEWRLENEWNKKVYNKWSSMLVRCYSKKFHEKNPTYYNCSVCSDWLKLSGFVKDFSKIDGYDRELFLSGKLCLDKDIKSNGQNKEYSLENCMLVSIGENSKQSRKTTDYSFMQGENNPSSINKIAQYDEKHNLIKIWDYIEKASQSLNIDQGSISKCCKFWDVNCNKEEWFKSHKSRPCKFAGGYIWKYYKGDDENEKQ